MENLTYKRETVYKKCDKAIIDAAYAYAEGYKAYLVDNEESKEKTI